MKICILGNTTGNIDEGMKKITYNLSNELAKTNEVLVLNPLQVFSTDFWKSIRDFKPQIIHYVPGPSIKSLILAKTVSLYCKDAKIVMSAPFPKLSEFSKRFIHLFKPDLMLVQSGNTEKMFRDKKFNTKFFPLSGVETARFTPASENTKNTLREKYNINKDAFVVLHVGHIKEGRNIQILKNVQEEKGNQVIIVGSTSAGLEASLHQDLKKNGCIVFSDYVENINEIYALSDCYIFPVIDRYNSIEMPLSVLEAMACGIPVITTRFGALPQIFKEGDGLFFVENETDIKIVLQKIKKNNFEIRTREKVLLFSWENIAKRLEEIYYNGLS